MNATPEFVTQKDTMLSSSKHTALLNAGDSLQRAEIFIGLVIDKLDFASDNPAAVMAAQEVLYTLARAALLELRESIAGVDGFFTPASTEVH